MHYNLFSHHIFYSIQIFVRSASYYSLVITFFSWFINVLCSTIWKIIIVYSASFDIIQFQFPVFDLNLYFKILKKEHV